MRSISDVAHPARFKASARQQMLMLAAAKDVQDMSLLPLVAEGKRWNSMSLLEVHASATLGLGAPQDSCLSKQTNKPHQDIVEKNL
mmetsp:Transcript_39359/g.97542  ORF Transcript_39359/g.97542 Transcript_39359/m.97542 type:complete len:86 (+) Transcript_39359:531-788(+)